MADRNSAYLFAEIFRLIDEEISQPEQRARLADKFWEMSRNYDFDDCQMVSDEALTRLGLASIGVDPDYPGDGPTTLYKKRTK